MALSYRHFERSEKSFLFAAHWSMIGKPQWKTGYQEPVGHRPIHIRGAFLFLCAAPPFLISNFSFNRGFQRFSNVIKGRHAPRANPAPRFNFLYHTVRDREKQSRKRKICIFETSVVEYILRFSVFCKNKRWFNIVGKTDLRRNNFYERKSRGTGSAQGISRH